MGGRGSEAEGRSSGKDGDAHENDVSDPPSPESAERSYGWWGWRDDVDDLDGEVRDLASHLAEAVVAGSATSPSLGESCPEIPVRECWEAVSCLHRSLEAHRRSAPPAELSAARRRLDEVCGELWVATVQYETAALRDFVREVAHDLRSPLHSILFLTDALFREESGSLNGTQKRQVSVVHSAAAALLRMSNDLLDLSGTDEEAIAESVSEVPFSPVPVVEDLESLLEPVSHHHKAHLEIQIENTASRVGDPQVLKRVLLNLASNAMEAVDEDGMVRIRLNGNQRSLQAVVEDDCGGADPEKIRDLLDRGGYSLVVRRLGGETRGLGLVICGRMVRAVDGDVHVECTQDGWTRFSVTLPFPVFEAGV